MQGLLRGDIPRYARKLYDQAVRWMAQNKPKNEELVRFRAEAEELLGIDAEKPRENEKRQHAGH